MKKCSEIANNTIRIPSGNIPNVVIEIANKYGTPVFIIWESIFRENCRFFNKEFSLPGRTSINSYSYKTNNVKSLCSIAHEENLGAEVVSPSELDMALQLGVAGNRIFYNGPLKSDISIIKAISSGVAIHVDSLSELTRIIELSESSRNKARIALRLTPETGERHGPVWSKFGFSVAEGEVKSALDMIAASNKICVEGLHMHIGTNLTDTALYRSIAQSTMEVAMMIKEKLHREIQYIDIGGGFSAPSGSFPMTAHPEEWVPISIRAVANVVAEVLDQFDPERKLTVVTEPGRVLAESSMELLTSIAAIKQRGTHTHIVLDGGTNIIPSAYYTKHPVSFPGKTDSSIIGTADFHGPLCTQYDVVASEVDIPELAPNDLVLIHGVGAYTYTFSAQFVGPRPPVVFVSDQAKTSIVRQKEPDNIIWQYDQFPDE
jgi:diaminopimelate decarboxylase